MTSLSDVAELIVDSEHKTAPVSEEGYPYIRTPNIGRGYIILDGVKLVSEESYKVWTKRAVPQEEDLILAREAPVGNVAIIPNNLKVCLGQRTVLIRPDKKIVNPRYLMFLLLSDKIQQKFHAYSSGATVPHLNLRDIRRLSLPKLPSMCDQKRIGNFLGIYDDLIRIKFKRIKILETIAQSLYNEWFVNLRFPGYNSTEIVQTPYRPIVKDWPVTTLSSVLDYINETEKAGKHLYNLCYVPIDCISRKSLFLGEVESGKKAKSSLIRFKKYDILFGAMRPYFHKVTIAPFEGVTRKTCFVLRPKKQLYYSFSVMTLFQKSTIQYANSRSRGSTIPYAVWDNGLAEMPINLPTENILKEFNKIILPIIEKFIITHFMIKTLRNIRDLLIPKLISGEIDVSNLKFNSLSD